MHRSAAVTVVASVLIAGPAHAAESVEVLRELDRIGRNVVSSPCATPLSIKAKVIPNRHDKGIRDEVKAVKCPGLLAEVYIPHGSVPGRQLPLSLVVDNTLALMPKQLQVGSPVANVSATLGKAKLTVYGSLTYDLPSEAGNDTITFKTRDARVTSIHWSWDID